MKKIIALLLAFIMTFSIGTVAFAEGETETPDETTTQAAPDNSGEGEAEEEPGDFDWLLDLPFWTVKPGLKFAKIALKLAKVVVKLGVIFGLIDKDDIIGQIQDLIDSSMNQEEAPEETPEEAPEETTTAPAAA